jgi:hypothetical protein
METTMTTATTPTAQPTARPTPEPSAKPGSNTLLVGATGTGKTYSIRTFLDAGITPFIIATEPGIESTLGDIPADQLHWHYIPPASAGWDEMLDSAKKINMFDLKALTSMTDINKRKYGQFMDVISTCNNFLCDRTGESYGDVSSWGPDKALIIDSLSGLNIMAMNLVVGSKPVKSMADWGIAMDNLERLIIKLTTDLKCYFVLTAHLERETDEVTGGTSLMASTLGRKLAPRIPRFFDDVVMCQREGNNFSWTTTAMGADLKARNLPWGSKIEPTFKQIVEKRNG